MIGKKSDDGKLRWDLIPWKELEEVVRVLMFGAKKYGDNNWQYVENSRDRYFNAAMRHIVDSKRKVTDSESGYSHYAHAICCLLFLMWENKEEDVE